MPDYDVLEIENAEMLIQTIKLWKADKRGGLYFDTETTGLHIIQDAPFLLQFGWWSERHHKLRVIIVDKDVVGPELFLRCARAVHKMAKVAPFLCGHNIKFDIHMLCNMGIELDDNINYKDTMIYIRAGHDALVTANGGPPLGLKDYCSRYIDRRAKDHERMVQQERASIAKEYNLALKKTMGWTLKRLDAFFKDCLNSVETMEAEDRDRYSTWLKTVPEDIRKNMTNGRVESNHIPYTRVNRKILKKYAALDIVYTYAIKQTCAKAIKARGTERTLELEEIIIPALIRMERCGFQINKDYVLECQDKLLKYIKQRRADLLKYAGRELSVAQHAVIKELLKTKFNLDVKGTGDKDLQDIVADLKRTDKDPLALKFIETVREMRTLEKWYSTYLQRFLREMKTSDRIYTQINQVGTVAGRVTSDFQQFPREGIYTSDGEPLFNPRAMVCKSPDTVGIAYLDYSQIELRGQAMYTILVGTPDTNLCRAYMPYKCHRSSDNKPFDYKNANDRAASYTDKWLQDEDEKEWSPIDVHFATALQIVPELTEDHPEYKFWRSVGKTTNFAKNYGAKFARIKQMFPDFDDDTIHKIDNAYYDAFPGVKGYHDYCYTIAMERAYVPNLYGVKYYGLNGHKLINALIQGSCAYFLKDRIYQVDKYIKENNLKTRIQMQIHDELSFEVYPGEEHHILEIQKIMSHWEGFLIPIVADLELTVTDWASKQEASTKVMEDSNTSKELKTFIRRCLDE